MREISHIITCGVFINWSQTIFIYLTVNLRLVEVNLTRSAYVHFPMQDVPKDVKILVALRNFSLSRCNLKVSVFDELTYSMQCNVIILLFYWNTSHQRPPQ